MGRGNLDPKVSCIVNRATTAWFIPIDTSSLLIGISLIVIPIVDTTISGKKTLMFHGLSWFIPIESIDTTMSLASRLPSMKLQPTSEEVSSLRFKRLQHFKPIHFEM